MTQLSISALEALPKADSCYRIDFKDAEIVGGFINDTFFLIVRGEKPWVTMEVSLRPLIYIDQPDYWGIEVVGCQSGIGLPATAPYEVSLPITGSMGKKGIEVLGATASKKFDYPF